MLFLLNNEVTYTLLRHEQIELTKMQLIFPRFNNCVRLAALIVEQYALARVQLQSHSPKKKGE